MRAAWEGEGGVRAVAFVEALGWTEENGGSHVVGTAANRVVRHTLHLIFFFAEKIAECYAPVIQFDDHPH